MILQRAFEAVLSALDWLIDLLFPRVVLLAFLLVLGLGVLVVLVGWRGRTRGVPRPRRGEPPQF